MPIDLLVSSTSQRYPWEQGQDFLISVTSQPCTEYIKKVTFHYGSCGNYIFIYWNCWRHYLTLLLQLPSEAIYKPLPKKEVTLLMTTPDTLSRNNELLKDGSKYSPYINIMLHKNESLFLMLSFGSHHCDLWSEFDKYGLLLDRELLLNKMLN